jgi:hypothetical protein
MGDPGREPVMSPRSPRRAQAGRALACVVVLAVAAARHAPAQTKNSYPMLLGVHPAATTVGATTDHELSARYNLAGATAVMVSGAGVRAEPLPLEAEKPEDAAKNDVGASKCRIRFTCDADAVPGIRDFRVLTPHGASTVGQIVVARSPAVAEAADNDAAAKPQPVSLPATLCGRIEKAEDVDWYRVRVESPGIVVFHMTAQRLENRIHDMQQRVDPLLTLRDAAGATLASSDNVLAGDPLLQHRVEAAGDYLLEVRDVRYQGNPEWVYAIEAAVRPFATSVHPLAVPAGGTAEARLFGPGLGEAAVATLAAAAGDAGRVIRVAPVVGGASLESVAVFAAADPILAEPAGADAAAVRFPAVIVGQIAAPGEADRLRFTARADEPLAFEVLARRLGSGLDPSLRILRADGGTAVEADDATFDRVLSADPFIESWKPPAAGDYVLEIRDLHGRGGEGFPYAIRATRAEPGFSLEADTDKTLLAPGSAGVVYVKAVRRAGFTGAIGLTIDGLPPGVRARPGRILETGADGCIWLEAAPDAPAGWAAVVIGGTASLPPPADAPADAAPRTIAARATPLQEIYMPGGGRGHYPVEAHVVSVARPMDVRKVTVSTTRVELAPGAAQRIDVTVERAADYTGNLTLDVMLQHLERPFGNPLPKGVTVDVGASKTLLTAGETAGHITLKAAADAAPVEEQLVTVNVHASINFVMKHTFCSQPLTVTVRK